MTTQNTAANMIIAPWGATNHSNPAIQGLAAVNLATDQMVRDLVRGNFQWYMSRVELVRAVSDPIGGNLNFRVDGPNSSVLVRIFSRNRTFAAVKLLHEVHHAVAYSGVFSQEDCCLALLPIEPKGGGPVFTSDGRIVAVYPYLDKPGLRHFAGQSLAELKSVGLAYGRLHAALQTYARSGGSMPVINCSPWAEFDMGLYQRVWRALDKSDDQSAFESASLFSRYEAMLSRMSDIVRAMPKPVVTRELVYHDSHPHNVVCVGDECQLIYDYETVSPHWSLAEALAFGLHRFVREVVRRQDVADLFTATNAFLDAFVAGGGRVPDGFRENLEGLIALPNLAKLLTVMAQQFGLMPDDRGRTPAARHSEVRKFIMYLIEAQHFGG